MYIYDKPQEKDNVNVYYNVKLNIENNLLFLIKSKLQILNLLS